MMRLAIPLLLSALAAGACGGMRESFPHRDRALRAMWEARPYLLRLDERAPHRPCRGAEDATLASLRCDDALPAAAVAQLSEIAVSLGAELRGEPSLDALWAGALVDLWAAGSDHGSLARAVDRLEAVSFRRPTDAVAAHHLAVALAAQAAVLDDPRTLFRALDLTERALRLDASSRAARWNRAQLLTLLVADSAAQRTWSDVLAHEPDANWRADGQSTLARIRARARAAGDSPSSRDALALRDAQWAREWVMDSLLSSWAAISRVVGAPTSRGDSAHEPSRVAARIGAQLHAVNGDSSVLAIARDMARLERTRAAPSGWPDYVEAKRLYDTQQWASARPLLERAIRRLRADGAMALAAWAELLLAGAHWALQDFTGARRLASVVEQSGRAMQNRALEARASWLRALIESRAARMGDARVALARGDSLFRSLGEYANVAFLRAIDGEFHRHAGNALQAARAAFDGLTLPVRSARHPRIEQWVSLSDQLRLDGASDAALAVLEEAALRAPALGRAKDLPEILGRRAEALVAAGRRRDALDAVDAGRGGLSAIESPEMRARTQAELDRAASSALLPFAPDSALTLILRARLALDSIALERPTLLLRSGAARLASGDTTTARAEIEEALAVAERRVASTEGDARRQAARTLHAARRQSIALALAVHDSAGALLHARALTGVRAAPRPTDGPVVSMVALEDRTLSWVDGLAPASDGLASRASSLRTAMIDRESLIGLVRQFRMLVRTGADPTGEREVAQRLHRVLLSDVLPLLPPGEELAVRTDAVLAEMPLAALMDSAGSYLVERYAITVLAPVESRRARPPRNPASEGRLLVVAPSWDRTLFPGLEPLPWARKEAEAIAAIAPRAELLLGEDATAEAFLAGLARGGVVHFAGHAVVDAGGGHLVLAGPGGRITSASIRGTTARGVSLLVLSACGRAGEAGLDEPVNELIGSVIEAGAQSVVASLWEVGDRESVQVAADFFDELGSGVSATIALRRIQSRAMAGSPDRRRAASALMLVRG